TLLHDDVIDESMMRRNKPTANNVWGNKAVILVGDYLFSRSFQLMVEDKSLDVLRVLSTASSIISEGEVMQLDEIGNFDLSYDKYIKIISAKTAELFAASCEISPLTADNIDNKLVSVMREIGLYLGIAFQIMDDVIDYSPSPKKGKNQGDDFLEGKVTLPLILLRDKLETPAKTKLYQIFADLDFTKESFAYVYTLIEKYNILEKSVTYAEEYINKARQKLESFPDSYAKEAFEEIFKFSLERNF
ncbi:MAG: polyprenyl synthetase family protein, partial [Alphaproteobacteria bacterium]|nr:polyprenyl synthetase family protein [Alphaproteobacteria bacterium]